MAFYCEECRVNNEWPRTFMAKSEGACEFCGKHAVCHDAPMTVLEDDAAAEALEAKLRADGNGDVLDAIRNDDPNLEQIMDEWGKRQMEKLRDGQP